MAEKKLPFSKEQVEEIGVHFPTPFHLYDEAAIVDNVQKLIKAFAWSNGFKEYFAVKATPNPYIMKLLKRYGVGADCSSLPELLLAEMCGITGEEIMFTSNDTPANEFKKARALGAIINLDDLTHIAYLEANAGLPEQVSLRFNPGALRLGNSIIGHPEEAKYGFTREQLFTGFKQLRDKGVSRYGLHTMVASNELNPQYFIDTAEMLFDLAVALKKEIGIQLEFVNIGGGVGIPYRPEDTAVDIDFVAKGIQAAYERIIVSAGLHPLKLYMECGRMITGPYGYLVTRVLHVKETYKKYIGLDACMANLMRPALYNAYHHITVLGKTSTMGEITADVTGSLCENNDKFAIDRKIPNVNIGDIVVFHDTGAHGHAMGFNYNGKLRSAELLLRSDGSVFQIRRAETVDDYFATLNVEQVYNFAEGEE